MTLPLSEQKPPFVKGHLSKPQKRAVAKVLYEFGWGKKELSKWLKLAPDTIKSYAKAPTPESMKTFEMYYRSALQDMNMESLYVATRRARELVAKERDLNKVIKAAEFFRGTPTSKGSPTQVNIYNDLIKKYSDGSVNKVPVQIVEGNYE